MPTLPQRTLKDGEHWTTIRILNTTNARFRNLGRMDEDAEDLLTRILDERENHEKKSKRK